MFTLRRPSDAQLESKLDRAQTAAFTYPEVGATAAATPAGYRHDQWTIDLGADTDERWERAKHAVTTWVAQRGAQMTLTPDDPVVDGLTFVLCVPLPLFGFAIAPGRVVYVVDEPTRVGFAYGTLDGHPEQGEEAFVVERRDGQICYQITAFSKPRHLLARVGGPVSRRVQLAATKRYLAAMQAACA